MSLYLDIISKRRNGPVAGLARAGLFSLSVPYGVAVTARNWFYEFISNVQWLDRPCVSVGNLTTGGTGKTPLVIWLASRLSRSDKKVAILSRGYKGSARGNDELKLVSDACPHAVCIAHPDRANAGRYAVSEHNVDVILLDDGFQHRKVGRDLDIVLIDASRPLGYGHLLPCGLLREPVGGLKRADVIVFTRINQTSAQQLATLKARCAVLNSEAMVLGCDHRPTGIVDLLGNKEEISQLSGKSILAFSGVGHPHAFARSLADLGAKPFKVMDFPDHHNYSIADCRRICETAQQAGAEMMLTTEKDLVKLRSLQFDWPMPLSALRIVIDFVGDGGKMLLALVNELCEAQRHLPPSMSSPGPSPTPPLP